MKKQQFLQAINLKTLSQALPKIQHFPKKILSQSRENLRMNFLFRLGEKFPVGIDVSS